METLTPPAQKGWSLTANQLKLIAIIAMAIDHTASLFVSGDSALGIFMHIIGRITGPTMFFLAAAGYHYTRNVNRYMARLGIFALVSYIPFVFAFSGSPIPQGEAVFSFNVIYTIFLGVAAIRIRHSAMPNAFKFILIMGIYWLATMGDWGQLCISFMLVFDIFQGDFKKQFWGYLAIVFIQAGLLNVFIYPLYNVIYNMDFDVWERALLYATDWGMILPALLLTRYNGRKGRGGAVAKYGFYVFYPLHLLLLAVLAHVVFA